VIVNSLKHSRMRAAITPADYIHSASCVRQLGEVLTETLFGWSLGVGVAVPAPATGAFDQDLEEREKRRHKQHPDEARQHHAAKNCSAN